MGIWSIYVELGGTPSPDVAEVLDSLTEDLRTYAASAAVESNGNVSVQLSVDAADALTGLSQAIPDVLAAARAAGMTDATVQTAQLLTDAEFERRVLHPAIPKLASQIDLAGILGVSKQRALVVVRDHADRLPVAGETGAGKLWLWATAVRFNQTWDRQPAGRPTLTAQERVEHLARAVRQYAADQGLSMRESTAGGVTSLELGEVRVDIDESGAVSLVVNGALVKRFDERPFPSVLLPALTRVRASAAGRHQSARPAS